MVSLIISIRPKWCDLIARGIKTIEVRKSRPKPSVPFKCYIYCTKDAKGWFDFGKRTRLDGKVIGEFTCKTIGQFLWVESPLEEYPVEKCYFMTAEEGERTCLSYPDIVKYGAGKDVFLWDISELKIYDKPLELSALGLKKAPQDWCYVKERIKKSDAPTVQS